MDSKEEMKKRRVVEKVSKNERASQMQNKRQRREREYVKESKKRGKSREKRKRRGIKNIVKIS